MKCISFYGVENVKGFETKNVFWAEICYDGKDIIVLKERKKGMGIMEFLQEIRPFDEKGRVPFEDKERFFNSLPIWFSRSSRLIVSEIREK